MQFFDSQCSTAGYGLRVYWVGLRIRRWLMAYRLVTVTAVCSLLDYSTCVYAAFKSDFVNLDVTVISHRPNFIPLLFPFSFLFRHNAVAIPSVRPL